MGSKCPETNRFIVVSQLQQNLCGVEASTTSTPSTTPKLLQENPRRVEAPSPVRRSTTRSLQSTFVGQLGFVRLSKTNPRELTERRTQGDKMPCEHREGDTVSYRQ